MARFTRLTEQLTSSEQTSWKDQWQGRDRAQKERTKEQLQHYFVDHKGHMQKGQPLYSRRKQSQFQRFLLHSPSGKFEDWESTSEYDMDIEKELVQLTSELETRIKDLCSLEEEQPLEEETVQLVQMVIPVSSVTLAPPMEVDGALPTTMGPGWASVDGSMLEIFVTRGGQEDEEELEDYMDEQPCQQSVSFGIPWIRWMKETLTTTGSRNSLSP